jgi:hypothetical protein
MLRSGGLMVITNVHPANPARCYMDFSMEWHSEHGDVAQMLSLARDLGSRAPTDSTTVSVFEMRNSRPA